MPQLLLPLLICKDEDTAAFFLSWRATWWLGLEGDMVAGGS